MSLLFGIWASLYLDHPAPVNSKQRAPRPPSPPPMYPTVPRTSAPSHLLDLDTNALLRLTTGKDATKDLDEETMAQGQSGNVRSPHLRGTGIETVAAVGIGGMDRRGDDTVLRQTEMSEGVTVTVKMTSLCSHMLFHGSLVNYLHLLILTVSRITPRWLNVLTRNLSRPRIPYRRLDHFVPERRNP